MYGIVNKAIEGLVREKFGEEAWKKVLLKSGVKDETFLSNEPYPDETTYALAGAASEVLNLSIKDVLINFGEYWILRTAHESYGSLMKAGGNHLREFLINLPNFHSRVMLIYPNLTPPEFLITDLQEKSLHLHYISKRNGLRYFMHGLIQGLGKLYETEIEIISIADKEMGDDHDIFKVNWQ